MGQTTGFKRDIVKKHILIMGKMTSPQVKYIHGNYGKGTFTFWEAMTQKIISILLRPKLIFFIQNSPGYRLILNNILFQQLKRKKEKHK